MTELKQKLKNTTQNLETSLLEKKVNRWLITRGLFISVIMIPSTFILSYFLLKHSFLIAVLDGFLWGIVLPGFWIILMKHLLKVQQKRDFPVRSLPETFIQEYDHWILWVGGGFGLGYLTFFFLFYILYVASWSPFPTFLQDYLPPLRIIPFIISIILSFVGAPYLMIKLRKRRKNKKVNCLKRQKSENSNAEITKKPLGII